MFGVVIVMVKNDIFNCIVQFGRQVVINCQLFGVDDVYVYVIVDGVVEEYCVDSFMYWVVVVE